MLSNKFRVMRKLTYFFEKSSTLKASSSRGPVVWIYKLIFLKCIVLSRYYNPTKFHDGWVTRSEF